MDDLIEFLRARLDEDEVAAAEAMQETTGRWTARETDWGAGPVIEDDCGALIQPTARNSTHYQHIARHDPARVVREVRAKQRIVEQFTMIDLPERSSGDTATVGAYVKMQAVLRLLALPYATHPDYRPEWAPDA